MMGSLFAGMGGAFLGNWLYNSMFSGSQLHGGESPGIDDGYSGSDAGGSWGDDGGSDSGGSWGAGDMSGGDIGGGGGWDDSGGSY